ncbi:glycosyltransferase family 2 protein [Arcanobacterium haemolyticum]
MVIDIMVPYWGRVDWLEELVSSVKAQDCDHWRLVIIDDCYPGDAAKKFIDQCDDDRISYIRNEENIGLAKNFQRCLELSSAEYVVIPGCDDRFLPNYISAMQRTIAQEQPDIVQPGVRTIDENGTVISGLTEKVKALIQPKGSHLLEGEIVATSLMRGNWLYWPSLMIKREKALAHGFRDFFIMLDLGLIVDMILDGARLYVLEETCFEYRRSASSVSGKTAIDGKRFVDERAYFALVARLFAEKGWKKAARAARFHITSRIHAGLRMPNALIHRDFSGMKMILDHLIR